LLWQIVNVLPEGVMLRLGMTNPPYIVEHLAVGVRLLAWMLVSLNSRQERPALITPL
jgi:hypothetical protein